MNKNPEFDFTRNDKFYCLKIPSYHHVGDLVYYDVHLYDLVLNKTYMHSFRFKELKEFHEDLLELKLELPDFPRTHFWKKTNKSPKLIEERREILEKYLNIVLNDPFTRGYKDVKRFIGYCRLGNRSRRVLSERKCTSVTDVSRVKSLSKGGGSNSVMDLIKKRSAKK